jgi:glucokinase
VVQDGVIIDGAKGLAVEFGHTTVDVNGDICACGNVGCIEVYASGTGLKKRTIAALQSGTPSIMHDLCKGDFNLADAKMLGDAAQQGDALALEIFQQTGKYLGAGIVNILHSYNPEIVVLGGGVTQNWRFIAPTMHRWIENHAMRAFRENVPIVLTNLGDEIGLYGAVALVISSPY